MKNNSYLKDENILTLFSLNNLIVPEIQREYVWGKNTAVLKAFLCDLERKAQICEGCRYAHTQENVNVGFLYSYKPSYVTVEHDRFLDEYLIDGQQRITTIFLLLLSRAVCEDRIKDFTNLFRVEENALFGFNFKVRELTRRFILDLVRCIKDKGKEGLNWLETEDRPSWMLDDYKNDPTVSSMLETLKMIPQVFKNDAYYFDYLLQNIHFWHFKTEVTSQGEELYITMNSRGEQLVSNEMKKARMLPADHLKEWGEEWEKWQDFFWKHRKDGGATDNINADKGFNRYLDCIESLCTYHDELYGRKSTVDIETIGKYMKAIQYIMGEGFGKFVWDKYKDGDRLWFDDFKRDVFEALNKQNFSWAITKEKYNNQASARNYSMLMWPWMYLIAEYEDKTNDWLLIRLIHFYYVRFTCYKRSASTIFKIIDNLSSDESFNLATLGNIEESGVEDESEKKIFSKEEMSLYRIYNSTDPDTRIKLEKEIWDIQNKEYFRDGRDVGGNTIIGYLPVGTGCDYLEYFTNLNKNLSSLLNKKNLDDIKRILLFYKDGKAFWIRQSPYYYFNYETSSWKRIVRSENFITFYMEFFSGLVPEETIAHYLHDILEKKQREFFNNMKNYVWDYEKKELSDRKICIIYDYLLNGLWDAQHENIVFQYEEENKGRLFKEQGRIYKGKRYKDPGAPVDLPSGWQDKLKEVIPNVSFVNYPK